ncbi:hypothetical protein E6O75_ATG04803 [Venturia nashicola]|uniref:Uncharacterized protein n=1 Tax=Venturia nashicola TaxID=86259 RepID=A0A4Z1NYP9_9PEZI|nr:hypothetical protein E6O75_ATG04803 [Venturia nashicola]
MVEFQTDFRRLDIYYIVLENGAIVNVGDITALVYKRASALSEVRVADFANASMQKIVSWGNIEERGVFIIPPALL